ncbi:MAG: hypothetical protein KKD63_14390 [Proteobacteria bacterium]|nr:hypothetical protein [Desulfobulbaceae bacterium]MBU4154058.1 hypothetical protein [Pseudomonadota bacterium]MDP2105994.1 hypothetical protein [Desulfobulbaceae bacterium]
MSLKALAGAVLERNKPRNSPATTDQNPRNFSPEKMPQKLRDISGDRNLSFFTEQTNPAAPITNQAAGYGCGRCGGKVYTQVVNGWQCDECAMVFEIIGGSKGPQTITKEQ